MLCWVLPHIIMSQPQAPSPRRAFWAALPQASHPVPPRWPRAPALGALPHASDRRGRPLSRSVRCAAASPVSVQRWLLSRPPPPWPHVGSADKKACCSLSRPLWEVQAPHGTSLGGPPPGRPFSQATCGPAWEASCSLPRASPSNKSLRLFGCLHGSISLNIQTTC